MSKKTSILDLESISINDHSDIDLSSFKESLSSLKDFQLLDKYVHPDLSKDERLLLFQEIEKRDSLLLNECIQTLISSYIFTPLSNVKKILIEIVENVYVNFSLRINIINTMKEISENSEKELCCKLYINLLEDSNKRDIEYQKQYNVSKTLFWETYKYLLFIVDMDNVELISRINQLGKSILTDKTLDEDFRYKLLQSINKSDQVNLLLKIILSEIFFFNNTFKDYRYYIYVCQFLKNNNKIDNSHIDFLYNYAKSIESLNCIADISDFLLSLDEQFEYKQKAKELLESVSFDKKSVKTIYNNLQNIHHVDVDQSISPFIQKLIDMSIPNITVCDIEYKSIPTIDDEKTYGEFLEFFINQIDKYALGLNMSYNHRKCIKNSITRFIYDNTIYSECNISILQLLIKSYQYIHIHQFKDELIQRMCEELADMADTCTTGHVFRIVNIFSSYDVEMTIPIEEEVKSCIFARLQHRIGNKSDEEQEKIYDCLGSSEDIKNKEKQKHKTLTEKEMNENEEIDEQQLLVKEDDPELMFNQLLGKDIYEIVEELTKEYVEQGLIDEQTLNIYIRKAVSSFQIGEKI